MEFLVEALRARVNNELGLDELMTELQSGLSHMETHRREIASMLEGVPDFMVAIERDDWASTASQLEGRLKKVLDDVRTPATVKSMSDDIAGLIDELHIKSLGLRESAWSARGPSSHPGVNELLYILDRLADTPDEEMEMMGEYLSLKLDAEFARLEHQGGMYQELPEFLAQAMEELLPEYQEILTRVSSYQEMEEEEFEGLFEQLEAWGMSYSAFDLDFLSKRYSSVPTSLPCVNFALNCQLLYLDEVVTDDMVDYSVGQAVEIIQTGSDKFLEEQKLSDLDLHVYKEVLSDLVSALESIPEIEDKPELQEFGGELINLCNKFIGLQNRAETESGSRFDYKTDF